MKYIVILIYTLRTFTNPLSLLFHSITFQICIFSRLFVLGTYSYLYNDYNIINFVNLTDVDDYVFLLFF